MRAARLAWRLFAAGCVAYVITVWAALVWVWGIPWIKVRQENRAH